MIFRDNLIFLISQHEDYNNISSLKSKFSVRQENSKFREYFYLGRIKSVKVDIHTLHLLQYHLHI